MKDTYGIQEIKAEIAKTLRKHMEEHEAFLVELYKSHPEMEKVSPPGHEREVERIAESYEERGESKGKAKAIAAATAWSKHNKHGAHKAEAKPSVFHSAPSAIPKGVSHGHPMDTKKADPCEKCGMAKCMGKCDMSDVKPEVKKEEMDADKLGTNARKASKKAIRSGSAQDFMEASSAHEEASRAFRKEGKHKEADEHESRAESHKISANTLASAYRMSKSEFDELAAFVNTVSLYKGEDKNINTGNENMSSLADEAQGGKGPAKTGSTKKVSEGSGSGGDVLKGKKLGKAAIPMAAPKTPSIPKLPAKAPAAPAAAGPAGTKGDAPVKTTKKSVHNIF